MTEDLEQKYQALKDKVSDLEGRLTNKSATNLPAGVKIPKFDASGDFFKFLREFNILATASGWQPPDCTRLLPLFLEGEAKELYQNIAPDKKNNWRSLTEELSKLTKRLDSKMWARRMLAKAKLGGESVVEYANKIREWVEEACPDPDYTKEARESETIHYFLGGLPTALKRKLFFMQKPATLSEAMAQTNKVLQIKEELENDERGDEIKREIAELKEQVNAIAIKNSSNNEGERKGFTNSREFTNSNCRGNSRGRGNFRGPNRVYNWNAGQNFQRGRNFGTQHFRNPNFEPMGGNRMWNSNFPRQGGPFQARKPGFEPGRGNFSNFRGNMRGRGQAQNYRINLVGEEANPSTSSRRSPTPSMAFLTLCALACLFLGGTSAQYQICSNRVPMTPLWLPNVTDCSVPSQQKAAEIKISLFLPVRIPKQFPVYNCYQKMVKICTSNLLFLWKEIKSHATIVKGAGYDQCQKFKAKMDVTMKRMDEKLWATETPEKIDYAWVGERCQTTVNDFIEEGQGGILDFYLVTSFGHKLNPYKGWEDTARQTFIWEIPEPSEQFWATHFSVGEFVAEITDEAVIVESEQSVFYFEKEKSDEREGIIGVPEDAYKMSNDAFIVIHNDQKRSKRDAKVKIEPMRKERPAKQEVFFKYKPSNRTVSGKKASLSTTTAPTAVTRPTEAPEVTITLPRTTQKTVISTTPNIEFDSSTKSTTPRLPPTTTTIPKIALTTTVPKTVPNTFSTVPTPRTVTTITNVVTTTTPRAITTTTPKVVTTTTPKVVTTPKPKVFVTTTTPKVIVATTAKPKMVVLTTPKPKMVVTTTATKIVQTTVKPAVVSTTNKPKIITTTASPSSATTTTKPKTNENPQSGKDFPALSIKNVTMEHETKNKNENESITVPVRKKEEELKVNAVNDTVLDQLYQSMDEMEKLKNDNEVEIEIEEGENDETEIEIGNEEDENRNEEDEMINEENFEILNVERRKRTTVTTPEANWQKKIAKGKTRSRAGQENKNLNTRVNYALYRLNEDRKKEYDQIFVQACENSRFQMQLAKVVLQIEPSEGVRKIFDRDDLVARWHEESLEVGFCAPVTPEKIFWDRKIGNDCYEWTPVFVENATLFIRPGTRELSALGRMVECDMVEQRSEMKNGTQIGIVQTLNEKLRKSRPTYRNIQNPLILKAGAIFQPESIRIEETMLEYRSKMNTLPSSMLRSVQKPNITDVIRLIREEANETLGVVIGKTGDWIDLVATIPEKAKEAATYLKGIAGLFIAIPLILLFGLILYLVIKYRVIVFAGFRAGVILTRVIRSLLGMKRRKTRVAAVPTAPEIDPMDQETYILDYLPPRVATIMNDPRKLPSIKVHLNGLMTLALVDSCASVSYCRETTARRAGLKIMELDGENMNLSAANDSSIKIVGKVWAKIRIQDASKRNFGEWKAILLVSPDKHCPGPLLIGLPLLTDLKGIIALGERKVRLGEIWTNIVSVVGKETYKLPRISLEHTEILEPRTENVLSAKISESFPKDQNFLVSGISHKYPGVIVGRTLVTPGDSKTVIMQIMNAGNAPVKIYENSQLAELEPIKVNALPGDEIPAKDFIPKETRWSENLPVLPSHLDRKPSERLNLEGTRLSLSAQIGLKRIVDEFSAAFVGDDGKIGKYNGQIVHKIDLVPGSLPFHFRPYRYPPETQKEIERQIKIMLDQNIIRESESEFASPIVMVPKADKKSWRFAIDYRALNKMTKKRVFHLPNIQELLDLMGAKKYYSSMDMQSGFMQIPMSQEDIDKTAFISHLGIYEFITMPFGLTAAPDTFQRVMNSLRRRLTAAMLIYLDDIIIGSETEEVHLKDIENFLRLMKEVGLKLKMEKCHWGMPEIKYLGFLLSEKGVRMDPKQVKVVQDFRAPKSLTELKSLLGALTYFRRFIKNFAHIARPMQTLTQDKFEGKIEENWGKEQAEALETLKRMLTSAPILQSPRFGKPFVVECDASKKAVGAVLLQEDKPVAFASRALNRHEANYPSIEREALAIVYAVREFSPYIVGSGITKVITDCSALTGMMKAKELKGRLEKYQVTLQSYDLEIVYRPGKKNKVADFLSRYNIPGIGNELESPECEKGSFKINKKAEISSIESQKRGAKEDANQVVEGIENVSLKEVIEEQRKVKELAKIYYILRTGKYPKDVLKWKNVIQHYGLINEAIFFQKGKEHSERPKLIIPYSLRQKIFYVIHGEGHFGFEKTWQTMKERFYWLGMKEDVEILVATCVKCQKRKVQPGQAKSAPNVPIKPTEGPFQRVHCDLIGPLKKTEKGNVYILLAIDSFSKWIMAKPIPDQKANTVAETFVEMVIHQHSTPETVVTDQGRQFTSELFGNIAQIYGFEHSCSTPYHQQANGQAEGAIRILANIIAQMVNENGNNWDQILSHAIFAYNSSIHSATKQSPYFTLYLRHPKMPTDRLLKLPSPDEIMTDIPIYIKTHTEKAKKAWDLVKSEIVKAQKKYIEANDRDRKSVEREFEIGQLVLLKKEVLKHKFDQKWSGPFRCVGIEEEKKNVIVEALDGKGKMKKIHQEKIKPFLGPAILPLRQSDEPLSWEKYTADPNLEQEEVEDDDSSVGDETPENTEKSEENIEKMKVKESMTKFGFESTDEEEYENVISLVKGRENIEEGQVPELAAPMGNFQLDDEHPPTLLEILLENSVLSACTGWLNPVIVPMISSIPVTFVKENWEIFTKEGGEGYVMAWIFGESFEMFINSDTENVILGLEVQLLLGERWRLRVENEKESYWEIIADHVGNNFEILRVPEIWITVKEEETSECDEILNFGINMVTENSCCNSTNDRELEKDNPELIGMATGLDHEISNENGNKRRKFYKSHSFFKEIDAVTEMSSMQEPHVNELTDEEEQSLKRIERSLLEQLAKVKKRREMAVIAANDAPVEPEVIEVEKEEKEGSAKKEAEEKAKFEKKDNEEKKTGEKKVEDVISLDLNEESGEEDICSRAAHLGKVRSALWESVLNTEAKKDYQAIGKTQGSSTKKRTFNELEPPALEEEKEMGRSEKKGWPNPLSSGWPTPQIKPLAKWTERAHKAEVYERNSGEIRQILQRMLAIQQKATDIQDEAHDVALTLKKILVEMKETNEGEAPGKEGPPSLGGTSCFRCGRAGHFARECRDGRGGWRGGQDHRTRGRGTSRNQSGPSTSSATPTDWPSFFNHCGWNNGLNAKAKSETEEKEQRKNGGGDDGASTSTSTATTATTTRSRGSRGSRAGGGQ